MASASRPLAPATRLAHVARIPTPSVNQPVAPPLYQSVVYRFDSLDQLEAVYRGDAPGYFYYRYGTPNHTMLERAVADLERAAEGVATSSGLSALAALLLGLLETGDHVLVDRHVYGGSYTLLTTELPRLGLGVTFVNVDTPAAITAAARPRTRLLLLETLTNPTLRVPNLPRLATFAHRRGWQVVVDSTFTTPCLAQPLQLGADLVWHSTSKYFGGQSQALGGIVAGPSALIERVRAAVVHYGTACGPFDAWMACHGLATLALRMERASENALR